MMFHQKWDRIIKMLMYILFFFYHTCKKDGKKTGQQYMSKLEQIRSKNKNKSINYTAKSIIYRETVHYCTNYRLFKK